MATVALPRAPRQPRLWTVVEIAEKLGPIPAYRVRNHPPPGAAREEDLLRAVTHENCLCELIDGVLVEKTVGYYESRLAVLIGSYLTRFLEKNDLGILLGADGPIKLLPGQIRVPDVSFYSWQQFPNRELPAEAIPRLIPDLAVEVLSEGNTEQEMQRKLREYFKAGTKLVWYIDAEAKSARVYTDPGTFDELGVGDVLDGGAVLPGFRLSLKKLFTQAGARKGR